eukprot:752522-Prymnesium_polylepis.1
MRNEHLRVHRPIANANGKDNHAPRYLGPLRGEHAQAAGQEVGVRIRRLECNDRGSRAQQKLDRARANVGTDLKQDSLRISKRWCAKGHVGRNVPVKVLPQPLICPGTHCSPRGCSFGHGGSCGVHARQPCPSASACTVPPKNEDAVRTVVSYGRIPRELVLMMAAPRPST